MPVFGMWLMSTNLRDFRFDRIACQAEPILEFQAINRDSGRYGQEESSNFSLVLPLEIVNIIFLLRL